MKKWELIKMAYDEYPKGISVVEAFAKNSNTFITTGEYYLDAYGNILDAGNEKTVYCSCFGWAKKPNDEKLYRVGDRDGIVIVHRNPFGYATLEEAIKVAMQKNGVKEYQMHDVFIQLTFSTGSVCVGYDGTLRGYKASLSLAFSDIVEKAMKIGANIGEVSGKGQKVTK